MLDQILIALSVAAPGVLSYRAVREGAHGRALAATVGGLFSALWAGVVLLILAATPDTLIPGPLWASLATAVVVTEAFFGRTAAGEA